MVMMMSAITWLGPDSAQAQPTPTPSPSAAKGEELTRLLCSSCHVLPNATGTAIAGIPSMRTIANKPGQTAAHIEGILINPHPPMPDTRLTSLEIQHIIAYLETLRTDKSAPPLAPPPGPSDKPQFPRAS